VTALLEAAMEENIITATHMQEKKLYYSSSLFQVSYQDAELLNLKVLK